MEIGSTSVTYSNISLDTPEPQSKKPKLDTSQPQFGPNSSKGNPIGKEEPFVYLPTDHPDIESIRKFFALSPTFPTDNLFVRNATGEPLRAIYITNSLVKQILHRNPTIRLLNAGTRLFVRQPDPKSGADCLWRIHSDGLTLIDSFLGDDRLVYADVDEIWDLLKTGSQFPLVRDLKENIRDQIFKLKNGGFVIRVDLSKGSITHMNLPFSMPMWKSPQAVKYDLAPSQLMVV
jgi:multisite-specific tRNA:(cytosine-C5)-methyltransferase